MKHLHAAILTTGLALYFLLHSAQHHVLGPEWLRFYGKDVVFIPVLMAAMYHSSILMHRVPTHMVRYTLLATLYSAVAFEYVVPWLSPNAHGDPVDVLCYAAGACCYLAALLLTTRNKTEQILQSSQAI